MILDYAIPMDGAQGRSVNLDLPMPVAPNTYFNGVLNDSPLAPGTLTYDYYPVPADSQVGEPLETTMETWYYRLHFVPAHISFGNLSGDQQLKMYLWNAFFVPVDVASFQIVDGVGVTYTSDFPVPGDLPALQQTEYTFFASANGPPIIDATATWVIDGITYEIPITGRRAVSLPFRPNWSSKFTEVLSWKTTISTSYSGKFEQAISIRDVPRREFQYAVRLKKDEVSAFDLLTFGWLGRSYVTPLWHEGSSLAAPASLGDYTIYLDTRYRTFNVGGNAMIYKSASQYELVQIAGKTDTSLTLQDPVQQTLLGAKVYPALSCLLDGPVSTSRQSAQHMDASIKMTMNPAEGFLHIPDEAAPFTYLGEELYVKETNWREPLKVEIDPRDKRVDNGLGPIRAEPKATFPSIVRGFKWMLRDREAANALLAYLGRRKGRAVPVWTPSGVDDMFLALPALSTDVSLYVRPIDYTSLVGLHPARRHLLFVMRDGSRLARKIESVDYVGEHSMVTIDAPLGVAATPQNVKRISYLGLYRLGSDDIRFVWHTDTVAEVEVNLVLKEPKP